MSTRSASRRSVILRIVVLLMALVGLYVVWPSLLGELDRLPELDTLNPMWFVVMFACEAASFACLWMLQRLMLRSTRWYAVATAQLTENAVAKMLPGGTAAGEALQYRMLTTAGERPERVGVALAASEVVDVATVLALPVLSLPFILLGSGVAPGLGKSAVVGVGILLLVTAVMVPLVAYDRPLRWAGRAIESVRPSVGGELPERLVAQRDQILEVLSARWWQAILFAAGNWGFDYLALVTAVAAFDPGFPNPGADPAGVRHRAGAVDDLDHARRRGLRRGRPGGDAGACGRAAGFGRPGHVGLPAGVVLAGAPGRRAGVLALAPALRRPGAGWWRAGGGRTLDVVEIAGVTPEADGHIV